MIVTFLDFDGVLVTGKWMQATHQMILNSELNHSDRTDQYGFRFDEAAMQNLRALHDRTNCVFVVSSTWRRSGYAEMKNLWRDRNMPGMLYDVTPIINNAPRGTEIRQWLLDNGYYTAIEGKDLIKIQNYLIIDDDMNMLIEQADHFIKCDFHHGLTEQHVTEAIDIISQG